MPAFFVVRRFDAQKCGKDYYDVTVLFVIRRFDTQKCGKDYYDVTITRCLWHTACVENGCENPYCLFCDADDVTCVGCAKQALLAPKHLVAAATAAIFIFSESSGRLT